MLAADYATDKDAKVASEKMMGKLEKDKIVSDEEFKIGKSKVKVPHEILK